MSEVDDFRTRDHVPDFDRNVEWFREYSSQTKAALRNHCDLRYGAGEKATLDLFFPKERQAPAPIHLFIHGGYWRMFDKSDFSFVANTICTAGGIAAIMNYDLMPGVRMATIVEQVHQCASWLVENVESFGGDPARFSVSGHSAGGHLCCFLFSKDSPVRPKGILALSGIYDLSPLRQSFLQQELRLTDDEVACFSPISMDSARSGAMVLMVGEAETLPFHRQAAALRQKLLDEGWDVSYQSIKGANHMSIMAQLGSPDTIPGQCLAAMIVPGVGPGLGKK